MEWYLRPVALVESQGISDDITNGHSATTRFIMSNSMTMPRGCGRLLPSLIFFWICLPVRDLVQCQEISVVKNNEKLCHCAGA